MEDDKQSIISKYFKFISNLIGLKSFWITDMYPDKLERVEIGDYEYIFC